MITPLSQTPLTAEDRANLRRVLERRFDLEELKSLAFDIGVDYNALEHETTIQLSRELVAHCERRGDLSCLINLALCEREDELLKHLSTKLPPCDPHTKVLIITRLDYRFDSIKVCSDIADEFGIAMDEVEILGSALGSLRMLVSLPHKAADMLFRLEIDDLIFGRNQVISVVAFDSLDIASQDTWRIIARKGLRHPISWSRAHRSGLPIEHLAPPHIIDDEDNSLIAATPFGNWLVSQRLIWPPPEPSSAIDAPLSTLESTPDFLGIRQLAVKDRVYDVKPLVGDEPVQLRLHHKYWIVPLEGASKGELALVREQAQPDQSGQFVVVNEPTERRTWIDKVETTDDFTHIHIIGAERDWVIHDSSPDQLDMNAPHIIGIVEAILIPRQ